jgi:hypothetical protein
MKQFPVLFLFSLMFYTAQAQNLHGKWYMFSRNRLIEFEFLKDKLVSRPLNWNLSLREGKEPDSATILRQVTANENIYLYLRKPNDSTNKIRLITFKTVRADKEMILPINVTEEPFTDTAAVRKYILEDVDKKVGFTLYSYSEIQRLQLLKKVSEMTTDDFKSYVNKVIEARTEINRLSNFPHPPSANSILYASYSCTRTVFSEIGYNPLVTEEEFEDFFERFQNDPATKDLMERLMHQKSER